MAETLMFRKGLLKNLQNAPKVAGTISITTDEPGIYLDLSATERVRIGDFISYPTLAALKASVVEGAVFSTNALYYAEAENILCKYDGTQFKWINDTTELKTALTTLSGTVTGHGTAITNLQDALDDETEAREAAVENLQEQITALVNGATGDTLASLRQALNAEITRSTEKDTEHSNAIQALNTALANANEAIAAEKERAEGAESDLNDAIVAEARTARAAEEANATAIANEKTARETADNKHTSDIAGLTTRLGQAESDILAEQQARETEHLALNQRIGAEESRAQEEEGKLSAAISNEATTRENADRKHTEDITGLQTRMGNAEKAITDNHTAHTQKEGELSTAIADEKTRAEAKEGELDAAIKKEVQDREAAVGEVSQTVAGHGTRIGNLETELGTLEGEVEDLTDDLAQEVADREAANAELLGKINQEIQDRTNAINGVTSQVSGVRTDLNNEITNRTEADTQIRTDFAQADADTLAAAKEYVNEHLKAADAMKFMGGVGSADGLKLDLPDGSETPVEAGWTYVVTATYTIDGVTYYAGDLLIAKADQGEAATYTGGWEHVKTGYDKTHDPKMIAQDNEIRLSSRGTTGGDLGKVKIVSNNANLVIATDVDKNEISVSMEWGSF